VNFIAFANTNGRRLLIGVDDDGSIAGVKYPEEEWLEIEKELVRSCRPAMEVRRSLIRINEKGSVLCVDVQRSPRRPHYFLEGNRRVSFVREKDQSIKASREMVEVIRRFKSMQGVRFPYGDAEQKVIRFLADHPFISLPQFANIAGLNRFAASRKLVRLVLANVLRITPTEKGDIFSRQ
jgi:predicted HTH transcriptional regulator